MDLFFESWLTFFLSFFLLVGALDLSSCEVISLPPPSVDLFSPDLEHYMGGNLISSLGLATETVKMCFFVHVLV